MKKGPSAVPGLMVMHCSRAAIGGLLREGTGPPFGGLWWRVEQ